MSIVYMRAGEIYEANRKLRTAAVKEQTPEFFFGFPFNLRLVTYNNDHDEKNKQRDGHGTVKAVFLLRINSVASGNFGGGRVEA